MVEALLGFSSDLPMILVLLALSLMAMGERRVHAYNYEYLKVVAGEELINQAMRRYYRVLFFLPWFSWLSYRVLPTPLRWGQWPLLGLLILALALCFRIWAVRSLGRLWTQRCIFVPGMPRSITGPFRFLRHPEYWARAAEGLGQLVFFGLNPLAFGLWIYIQNCVAKICKVESRQLYELSVAPLQMVDGSSTVGASD